jgi:hypothetical protein
METTISKTSFNYLGLDFTPVRFFTRQDREAYITLNKLKCYKNKNLAKWNYTDFYKLAKEHRCLADIYLVNNKHHVIPCYNELFIYEPDYTTII